MKNIIPILFLGVFAYFLFTKKESTTGPVSVPPKVDMKKLLRTKGKPQAPKTQTTTTTNIEGVLNY